MLETINPGWKYYENVTFVPAVATPQGLLFISGLNAQDDDGRIRHEGDLIGQVRVVYEKLGELLAALGAGPDHVVKTTDYVLSRSGYKETAAVRRAFFGRRFPAATGVIVAGLFGRGVLFEMDAVATLPTSGADGGAT